MRCNDVHGWVSVVVGEQALYELGDHIELIFCCDFHGMYNFCSWVNKNRPPALSTAERAGGKGDGVTTWVARHGCIVVMGFEKRQEQHVCGDKWRDFVRSRMWGTVFSGYLERCDGWMERFGTFIHG